MASDSNPNKVPQEASVLAAANVRGTLDQIKMIATGGMAQIFQARQPSLDRYIVVKKLKEELTAQPEVLERFRREAKALASVLHQNVAHVYDFVESGRESFILMEYIDGIDLSAIIQKIGVLPADIASAMLLGVAKGVAYIHAHHLIHRDIKPSNIRLTTRGVVKLMDFGIVMDTADENLTRPGMMVGSPSYLSPEQVLGDPITDKADIFLLGICFYEMLTGVRPFKDEGGQTVFQRIREARYIPARKMNSAVPIALDRIIQKCLKKDPGARYESVKGLVYDLERYLGSTKASRCEDLILKYLDDEALLTPSVPYTPLEARKGEGFSFPLPWLIAVLFSLVLGFTLGYFLGVDGKPQAPTIPPAYSPPKAMKSK